MKILIVEDEAGLAQSISTYLKTEHYVCEVAPDFSTALEKIDEYDYDCILLDITLPGGDGLKLLQELKANQKTDGVIIISAKHSLEDRITGLNLGADDYLAKPFHLSELNARLAAVIRRRMLAGQNRVSFNEISLDTNSKAVMVNDKPVDLTRKEYELLLYFLANKGRVISKNAIAQHLWGDEMSSSYNFDFLYTHIKNLRRKLQEAGSQDYLKAVYGMGYKFAGA